MTYCRLNAKFDSGLQGVKAHIAIEVLVGMAYHKDDDLTESFCKKRLEPKLTTI